MAFGNDWNVWWVRLIRNRVVDGDDDVDDDDVEELRIDIRN